MRVYLAGPEVFAPDAAVIAARRRAMVREAGLEPLHPLDTPLDTSGSGAEVAARIFSANLALMERAEGCIASLAPFRGPNVDDGTAFEIGWMIARGRPVWGVDPLGTTLVARSAGFAGLPPRGWEVESFDLPVNLMLAIGIRQSGGSILGPDSPGEPEDEVFARAVAAAAAELLP